MANENNNNNNNNRRRRLRVDVRPDGSLTPEGKVQLAEEALRQAQEKARQAKMEAEQQAKEELARAKAERSKQLRLAREAARKARISEKRGQEVSGYRNRGDDAPARGTFIEFRDVRKTYIMGETEIHALDGVDFSIDQGEFVIVVGASGAGKTTILNILGGMDSLTSGAVYVDGNEVSAYDDREMTLYRRYDVGFVFQFYNLVQNLTARENVELATQVGENPLDVDATLAAVGLTERAGNFPSQLSGGEQQRVAIARALAKNPKLLLCDEPTGALDYNTSKQILELLQETARDNNMTVIIITHNYALTSVGDKVIRVKNGRIESVSRNEHPKDIRDVEW